MKKDYLKKLSFFMDVLLSNCEFVSFKVGKTVKNGFLPYSWAEIFKNSGFSPWEIEKLSRTARDLGWIESNQAREKLEEGNWFNHISNKRITQKYFKDLGLMQYAEDAKKASLKRLIKKWCKKYTKPVQYFLTPYSLLKKIKETFKGNWFDYFKDYNQAYYSSSPPYPSY